MISALRRHGLSTVQGQRYVMGTFLSLRATGTDPETLVSARAALFEVVRRLEEKLSIYRPDSEISQINQAAGQRPIPVSEDTCHVLDQALYFAALTDGAFDPTIQPMRQADYRQVILNRPERTVFLPQGMRLDLGGIGKGFALDQALKQVVNQPSVESVRMDFGGQLVFWNREGSFPAETVGIENPGEKGRLVSSFQVAENGSVSTSSQSERPGHLLDPRTGKPVETLASVTVVAPTATEAEAFSTALFVLGAEKGSALLDNAPKIQAFFWEGDSF